MFIAMRLPSSHSAKNEMPGISLFAEEDNERFVSINITCLRHVAYNRSTMTLEAKPIFWKKITLVLMLSACAALMVRSQVEPRNDFTLSLRTRAEISPESDRMIRPRKLRNGLWGGPHISMQVTGRRTTIEYDCAQATIDRAIVLDRNDHFIVSGRQFSERGGPVRKDEQDGYPVVFSGAVKGNTMTLTVENSSTKEDLGTLTLVHGAQPKLFKCK